MQQKAIKGSKRSSRKVKEFWMEDLKFDKRRNKKRISKRIRNTKEIPNGCSHKKMTGWTFDTMA